MLIFFIIVVLMLSALFSGAEIAFVSANKLRVELRKKKDSPRSRILAGFFRNPSAFLSTMLVGNTIVLIIFTYLMDRLLEGIYAGYAPMAWGDAWRTSFFVLLLNTAIITIVVLIFGEFLPKAIFRLYSDDIIYFFAYPLKVLYFLLLIPSWIMHKASQFVLKVLWKKNVELTESTFTRHDLQQFINVSNATKEEEIDKDIFGKALNLKEKRIKEAMIPRPEIEYIDITATVEELEQKFIETRLSRILVVKDDVDNVLGYVHHQQLLKQPKTIKNQILEIKFVPEVMRVRDLLNKFIKERINIACVVDEFGGVSGLVTLEDLLEEIFGEIEDEHDDEEYVEEKISDTEFLFSGRLEIDYLNEQYQLELPEGDFHTLSGYIVMTTETIPQPGTEIILDKYKFVLEQVGETKIETVRLFRLEG